MMYDIFNKVYGFTQCDYRNYIDLNDLRACKPCPENSYSLDNPPTKCYNKRDFVSTDETMIEKM